LNHSTYAKNNPLRYNDPTGHRSCGQGACYEGGGQLGGTGSTGARGAGSAGQAALDVGVVIVYVTQAGARVTNAVGEFVTAITSGAGAAAPAGSVGGAGEGVGATGASVGGAGELAGAAGEEGGAESKQTDDNPFQSGHTPKASEIEQWAQNQGWTRTQTPTGPIKYVDEQGVVRVTLKKGSSRTPGSEHPHVELRDGAGQRVGPTGKPVERRSPENHTSIDWDLP
jgi:hypothetical protein